MSSTEEYTTAARQFKEATEQSANVWKQSVQLISERADFWDRLPTMDAAAEVQRYFELLQQALDVNRELATKWVAAVNAMSGALSDQVEAVTEVVRKQVDVVADVVVNQAQTIDESAMQQARLVEERAEAERR